MKPSQKAVALLAQMAHIARMERGKVCQMKGREHFNHQTWRNGRNLVRYVPREAVRDLQVAIAGYRRFNALAQQYADEIIRRTRREHAQKHPKRPRRGPPARKKDKR
jgi:hypothetical protein